MKVSFLIIPSFYHLNVFGKIDKRGLTGLKLEFSTPRQMGNHRSAGARIMLSKAFATISKFLVSLNAARIYKDTGNYI